MQAITVIRIEEPKQLVCTLCEREVRLIPTRRCTPSYCSASCQRVHWHNMIGATPRWGIPNPIPSRPHYLSLFDLIANEIMQMDEDEGEHDNDDDDETAENALIAENDARRFAMYINEVNEQRRRAWVDSNFGAHAGKCLFHRQGLCLFGDSCSFSHA
eukprot:TRINITY_DN15367_c0_g1_i1.p2 TRINITY_DN15367_c0_g1~~TRINITY_DN15367_c0_g1_i1.p2  ORF type:complete len:158 (-),score=14.16 TRINITY_DN15367_c0_g1_i1:78-551(-)